MAPLPQALLRVPTKGNLIPVRKAQIAKRQEILQRIIDTVDVDQASFETVYEPVLRYDDMVSDHVDMIAMLRYASQDAEVQAKVVECSKLWSEHVVWVDSQEQLIRLKLAAGGKTDGLDPESKRLLMRRTEWLRHMGYGNIEAGTKAAFLSTRKQISKLCEEFNRNIRLYDGGHLLFSDAELKGLKEGVMEAYEKDQVGKRRVPMKQADYIRIMREATVFTTRKTFHEAWAARLPENVAIFREAILLRDENARRMGYKSDADFNLFSRMAKSTEWVEDLLTDLGEKLIGPGTVLFKEMEDLKRRLMEEKSEAVDAGSDTAVQPWERLYLATLLERDKRIDQKAISAYFPFKETSAAILGNISSYLQLRLEPVAKEDLEGCIWSHDVDVWAVWDEGEEENGQFVGYFYADLLDRENKYKHNQTVELQASYLREDGTRPLPAGILMCCFSPEVVDGCKVLKHENIITMYHELGHALQVLLSRTKWSAYHGYNVAIEFGEGIGTAMENYAWLKEELQNISCHYAYTDDAYMQSWQKNNRGKPLPPRTLPDGLIEDLVNDRKKRRIESYLKQLSDAGFDMAVHNPKSHEDLEKLDETKFYHDLKEMYTFIRPTVPSYPQADFSHLMSGYNSGYYSYICSNIFGEEIYQSNFAADPTSKTAWKRFRRELLQYGGSRDQTELLEEFLGRPPTTAALLKSVGVE
ncbi:hypothetical protein BB8028_0001g02000 [Beauveria bassiana]|uniref:Peptidase M3A/M3B catalytic domain-containing protein n=1 Tax=Beauveria bassiana TaxID=176275 RepID=A0A2S7XW61_BEABA|nr:hypothetical protein BB8028_0001g02000 [Beauveria bassiana]